MKAATVWLFDIGYWRWTPYKTYTTTYKGRSPRLRAEMLRERLLRQGHMTTSVRAVEGDGGGYLSDPDGALNGGPYPNCWSEVPAWWGDVTGEPNVATDPGQPWIDAKNEQMGRLYAA